MYGFPKWKTAIFARSSVQAKRYGSKFAGSVVMSSTTLQLLERLTVFYRTCPKQQAFSVEFSVSTDMAEERRIELLLSFHGYDTRLMPKSAKDASKAEGGN